MALDTRFPRPVGDGGNAASYPFPARVRTVRGASVERAVRRDPEALLDAFVAAGAALVDEGCTAIVTTCGFLAPLQREMARALPVPVGTSALLEVAHANASLGEARRAGILTIAGSALGPAHLRGADVPAGTPVASVEGGRFAAAILGDRPGPIDMDGARDEHVEAARDLVRRHPELGAIVLECANMPPFAGAIHEATGLPVRSILTLAARLVGHGGSGRSAASERVARRRGGPAAFAR